MSERSVSRGGGPRQRAYQRTEVGVVVLGALSLAAVILIVSIALEPERQVALVMLPMFGVVAVLFGWHTVSVDDGAVESRLGVGLVKKRIALEQVASVTEARFPWYWGWGVRLTPRGWLHRVSGLAGVELEIDGGKRFLIGSGEPRELARAIRSRTDHS